MLLLYKSVTTGKGKVLHTTFATSFLKIFLMKLLDSVKVGDTLLKNSMVIAPMARSRANIESVAGNSTPIYYAQRASAGLIISEAIKSNK